MSGLTLKMSAATMRSDGGAKDASEKSGSLAAIGAGPSAQAPSARQRSSAQGRLAISNLSAGIMGSILVDSACLAGASLES